MAILKYKYEQIDINITIIDYARLVFVRGCIKVTPVAKMYNWFYILTPISRLVHELPCSF